MQTLDPNHHRQRSEYIRKLVQNRPDNSTIPKAFEGRIPKAIFQFWHDLHELPDDVDECIASWRRWKPSGFSHHLFDSASAKEFISASLGARHSRAFERCYHPSMQADYFRLCFLLLNGGFYVDADDICVGTDIDWLFRDGRLKLQPLCYDLALNEMVQPSVFLDSNSYDPQWIFYFNNNPLVAAREHPITSYALEQATTLLELEDERLPEIQATTGPGNLSKSIFDLGIVESSIEESLLVIPDWDSIAISKWPLSYRDDARNWRYSNQINYFSRLADSEE